jgi:predicted P-loop ATPase
MSDITKEKKEYQVPPVSGVSSDASSESIDKSTCSENKKSEIVSVNNLDNARPLNPKSFPQQPRTGSNQIPATISNVRHMIDSYGIIVRYNTITKKLLITIPGYSGTPDNADNVAITQIISLAMVNGISISHLPSYIETIGDHFQFNPIADWITSKPWDGTDRLESFYETLTEREGFPNEFKKILMYRWMLGAVAAVLKPRGFKARGVLTLQGPQGIGKTTWFNALINDLTLRELCIKLDHHLDPSNKDSIITAVSHWIVEIGKLDSSFKKDIARLKGFLTSDHDKLRRPYGRTNSEYLRRTVFCATVNDPNFLVDATGNSRWWTIPVVRIDYAHKIDMQQLFAQVAVDFKNGEQWWLTPKEEKLLESQNQNHRAISVIQERVLEAIDLDRASNEHLPAMTPTMLLREVGISNPTNSQAKECAALLREHFGEPKKIQGFNKWRVPLKKQNGYSTTASKNNPQIDDDNLY